MSRKQSGQISTNEFLYEIQAKTRMENRYILPFSSKEATLERAGGKGANLAGLVRAGFAVPPGFVVSTEAYTAFVEANRFKARILALTGGDTAKNPAALEEASAGIRALFRQGALPAEISGEILSAYRQLPGSPAAVAVRSSATAEDLPGLAFAGQQDTYLNILGEQALLEAVRQCWGSLWTARAIAYRARGGISSKEISLAVIVQVMVASQVSGVAFTANPASGRRDEIVIDASYGLGEAIVSGSVDPDRYTVDPGGPVITGRKLGTKATAVVPDEAGGVVQIQRAAGQEQALADPQILELAQAAQRVAAFFGSPQDIEWAWANRQLYLLQARPITSLYPLPETLPASALDSDELRIYVNFNAIQGVSRPLTPLGMDALRMIFSGLPRLLHITRPLEQLLPAAGGRLFLDFTEMVRDPRLRNIALSLLADIEPGARQTLLRLLEEGRIPQQQFLSARRLAALFLALLPILRRPLAALLRPEAVRPRLVAEAEQYLAEVRQRAGAVKDLAGCLEAMERDLLGAERISINVMPSVLPVVSAALPLVDRWLSDWLGEPPGAALALMRGLPGNVTMEMDLKLWAAARKIRADPAALEMVQAKPAEDLAGDYAQGRLPETAQRAIEAFLQDYGMRGTVEIDIGAPRWYDDPAPILQILQGYLRLDDPLLAPDALFRQRVEQAENLVGEYTDRARKLRFGWLRARLLAALIRRMRTLGGLREAPLFYLAQALGLYRAALLDSARRLVEKGELEQAEDIFFVPFESLKRFSRGEQAGLKGTAAAARAAYERERLRRQMPRVLLSTGEAYYEGMPAGPAGEEELVGDAVSPGVVEGRVRVVFEPRRAQLEPGEILVCPATDPGWTPLFLTAGGLVMEIGGLMTHGSIVAREYGLPAVAGVHQATARLRDGQRVRVDGSRGRVIVLD